MKLACEKSLIFDGIEALSKYPTYVSLADKCIGINRLDDVENHLALLFAG